MIMTTEELVEMVRRCGQEIVRRAEEIAGSSVDMKDLSISISIDPESPPSIDWIKTIAPKKRYTVSADDITSVPPINFNWDGSYIINADQLKKNITLTNVDSVEVSDEKSE